MKPEIKNKVTQLTGVKRQYIGNLGKIETGIVAVTERWLFRGNYFSLNL